MSRVAQHPVQAFVVALAAVGTLSIMDAVMKHLVIALGIVAVCVWRAAANLALSCFIYLPRRDAWPDPKTLKIHVARGIIISLMIFLFFWGIGRVPLAQAIALTFIAPLIALLLASAFLKERVGQRSVFGSIVAFAGVIVIVLGQARQAIGPDAMLGAAAIIGSALAYAVNIVLMRRQALAAGPLEINFFQSLTVMSCFLIALPLMGAPSLPRMEWPWIVIASLLSTAGTLLFAWAYARGEASYLSVSEYSAFLWASALGWIVFDERVSVYTLGGAALIVAGCLIAARRKIAAPPEIDVAA